MSRYLRSIFTFTSLFLVVHLGLYLTQLGVMTDSSRWIDEALVKKEMSASSIDGRKILIISGSNALFSLSAEQISNELNIPTVNCGIHAGLRLEYILDRYLNLVGDNDIVLLPLEYSTYSYDGNTSETLADFLSSRDPGWLLKRPRKLINNAFSFNVGELTSRHFKRFRPDKEMIGFYDASYINSFGDRTHIDLSSRTEKNYHQLQSFSALSIVFSNNSKKVLEKFFRECEKRGATVILTFPATIYFEQYENRAFQDGIKEVRQFAHEHNIFVLGEPNDFFLPLELFYNSNYHTTSEGRSIATKRLIVKLRDYLKKNSEQVDGGDG